MLVLPRQWCSDLCPLSLTQRPTQPAPLSTTPGDDDERTDASYRQCVRGGVAPLPAPSTLSGSLILISYRGRKSGREFTVPVAYAEDADGLIVFVGHSEAKAWWHSMPGANVRVRLRGVDFDADASVVRGSSLASAYLACQPRSAGAIALAATNPVFVRLERLRPLAG